MSPVIIQVGLGVTSGLLAFWFGIYVGRRLERAKKAHT